MSMKGRILILAVIIAVAFTGSLQAARPAGLTSSLEIEKNWFEGSEDVYVRFTLTNHSARTVHVLRWETPVNGFERNLFQVARDGELVTYTGIMVKRAAPQPEDYIAIGAGDSLSALVDLSAAYDMSRTGEYTVRYHGFVQDLPFKAASMMVESNVIALWIDGRDEIEEVGGDYSFGTKALTPVYYYCSNSQKNSLATALSAAETMSGQAMDYLVTTPSSQRPSSQRYTTWFGTYQKKRWNTVKNNFVKITDVFESETVTFFCDCTMSAYAYVYPNKPYEIHLCNAFWSAPTTGTDSKAGTLIHETSHFKVVAKTADYAYGHNACKSLANQSPRSAIKNADSHEYFAENKPSLP
ncbi:MAG: peptidase M35 [bacterium]|nr:peptidase M35 [bacterium]